VKALRTLSIAAALALAAVAATLAPVPSVHAATPNVAVGAGQVAVIPLHLSKQYTVSLTAEARFAMPFACDVLGVQASARASGGTSPTLTIDVKEGGTTILSAPFAVTAGSVSEGTITDAAIADEAVITVDLAITGTSPTWDGVMVLLTCARK
jgi:hypothetical protein